MRSPPLLLGLTMLIIVTSCVSREERAKRMAAIEVQTCEKLRFKLGTEAFGNCRLQVRQIEAIKAANAAIRHGNPYNTLSPWYLGY